MVAKPAAAVAAATGAAGAAEAPPPPKRARGAEAAGPKVPTPDELQEGSAVLYWGGRRGFVRDAYAPLDEFWVTDAETGQIVRHANGEIVEFRAADLLLLPPGAEVEEEAYKEAGVLIFGQEAQMVQALQHFGHPNAEERCNPQQLLAVPCGMCEPGQLAAAGAQGVSEEVLALASRLRPDLHIGVRATRLRQALEGCGAETLRTLGDRGFYCLASVHLPYSLEAAEAEGLSEAERHRRKALCNQVDLCVTATRDFGSDEAPEAAVRVALGETCGMEVSDKLWDEKVQAGLRRRVGAPTLPLHVECSSGSEVILMLLPEDAVSSKIHGVLCFSEAPGADYASIKEEVPPEAPVPDNKGAAADASPAPAPRAGLVEQRIHGKTVREWEAEQHVLFPNAPKLPSGWIRIRSRKTGEVYFFNKKNGDATFDFPQAPLPPGWTQQVSKSTGKTYYFHAQRRASTFERPTA